MNSHLGKEGGISIQRRARRCLFLIATATLVLVLLSIYSVQGEATQAEAGQPIAPLGVPLQATPSLGDRVELVGHVDLEGRPAPPDPSWSVLLSTAMYDSSGQLYLSLDTGTGTTGDFLIPGLELDTYEICAKGAHTLRVCVQDVQVFDWTNNVDLGTLPEGDANNDNMVNAIDASILATAYWKSEGEAGFSPGADFNEDGVIDARDASLMASNYWRIGDPLP